MGGYAGMQAGSVRDKKGKSVYEAFQALELGQRQTILANIAKRVLEVGITAQMATTTTANGDVKI